MGLNRRRKEEAEPTVATDSISDVAFLLIIFFILTTSIQQLMGVKTDFPSAEAGHPQSDKKAPVIAVSDRKLLFNGSAVDIPLLRQRLLDLRLQDRQGEEKIVMVETSGKVEYQTYYQVLAAVTNAGGIIAVEREETGK